MTADSGAEAEAKPAVQHALRIIESHMPSSKEKAAIEIAMQAVDKETQLMDIASFIKTHYDKAYPGCGKATEGVYHAMCGTHFASASCCSCCRLCAAAFLGLLAHVMSVELAAQALDTLANALVPGRWLPLLQLNQSCRR
jgi:Dynein light chain type 1